MQRAESLSPHLIILDNDVPPSGGLELLRSLRSGGRFSLHPILVLSWSAHENDLAQAFDVGADDYVLKPFSPIELQARVKRLLVRTYRGNDVSS